MQIITSITICIVALIAIFPKMTHAIKNTPLPVYCEGNDEIKACRLQCARDRVSLV